MSLNQGYGAAGYGETGLGNQPLYFLPISYYLGLVTQKYAGSESFQIFLSSVLQVFQDISMCAQSMEQAFNLTLAVGPQLDMLGTLIGVSRTVSFQPSNGVSPVLDDSDYRMLLQARVAFNHFSGQPDEMQAIWKQLFPNGTILITDSQNMSVTITLTGAFTSIQQDLITNGLIIPLDQAVLVNYSFAELPLLGFDFDNAQIAGFATGHFS